LQFADEEEELSVVSGYLSVDLWSLVFGLCFLVFDLCLLICLAAKKEPSPKIKDPRSRTNH